MRMHVAKRLYAFLLVLHLSLEHAIQALAAASDEEDVVSALAKRLADIVGVDGESHCVWRSI